MPAPTPFPVAADIIVDVGGGIVLIERRNFPFGWAIPGGFVDAGETIEQAALREAREEISLEVELDALLGIYSRPGRDPRGQTITAVYIGRASGEPKADDDAKTVAIYDPARPPAPMAFDHAEILADYVHFIRTGEFPAPWRKR